MELADLLLWQDSYSAEIAKDIWDAEVAKALALWQRATEVHKARCRTGDLVLQEVYAEALAKLVTKIVFLSMADPNLAARVADWANGVADEATEAQIRHLALGEFISLHQMPKKASEKPLMVKSYPRAGKSLKNQGRLF